MYTVRRESFHVVRHLFDLGLPHAGISTKDQTVNGKEYKKDDRIFLDTKASNVDVGFFQYSEPGRWFDIFLGYCIQKPQGNRYRSVHQG